MSEPAVFIPVDGRFVATELARGPWDPSAQHGGAPAALMIRALERLPAAEGLQMSRVTYEFLRPVPIGDELTVVAAVARAGKRVQLLEGSITRSDGVEVVRARALQVQAADAAAPRTNDQISFPGPEQGRPNNFRSRGSPMFPTDAVEIRFVAGEFYGRGPASAWFRLRVPIVAGEQPTALQRFAAAGDFGNGISSIMSWDEHLFINPDLTLHIERLPAGEWILLDSQTLVAPDGIGGAESVLYDQHGRVGRAYQALLVAPR